MANKNIPPVRVYLLVLASTGWIVLGLQFYLMMIHREVSIAETVIRFFSFFTILTNLLVAVCATTQAFRSDSLWGRWFARANVQTAIAIYIFVVGLVYNLILRQSWRPRGLQKPVDEMLHVVLPLAFLLFWWMHTRRDVLNWGMIPAWLVYPAVYAVYVLVRGLFADWYPYPFLDLHRLGVIRVGLHVAGLVVLFLLLSLLAVALGRIARWGQSGRRDGL